MNRLQTILANKHTTSAAAVYVGALALSELGAIWFPSHAGQFKATSEAVKGLAVTYGFLMAGDGGKPQAPPAINAPEK